MSMVLKIGPGAKPNLPPIRNFICFFFFKIFNFFTGFDLLLTNF